MHRLKLSPPPGKVSNVSSRSKPRATGSEVPDEGVRMVLEVLKGQDVVTRSDVAKAVALLPHDTVQRAISKLRETGLIHDASIKELACAVEVLGDADYENLVLTSVSGATVEELI